MYANDDSYGNLSAQRKANSTAVVVGAQGAAGAPAGLLWAQRLCAQCRVTDGPCPAPGHGPRRRTDRMAFPGSRVGGGAGIPVLLGAVGFSRGALDGGQLCDSPASGKTGRSPGPAPADPFPVRPGGFRRGCGFSAAGERGLRPSGLSAAGGAFRRFRIAAAPDCIPQGYADGLAGLGDRRACSKPQYSPPLAEPRCRSCRHAGRGRLLSRRRHCRHRDGPGQCDPCSDDGSAVHSLLNPDDPREAAPLAAGSAGRSLFCGDGAVQSVGFFPSAGTAGRRGSGSFDAAPGPPAPPPGRNRTGPGAAGAVRPDSG